MLTQITFANFCLKDCSPISVVIAQFKFDILSTVAISRVIDIIESINELGAAHIYCYPVWKCTTCLGMPWSVTVIIYDVVSVIPCFLSRNPGNSPTCLLKIQHQGSFQVHWCWKEIINSIRLWFVNGIIIIGFRGINIINFYRIQCTRH